MVSEERKKQIQGTLNRSYLEMQGRLRFTESPVIQALEILADTFESSGMSKSNVDKAMRYLARILPFYYSSKKIEEALDGYEKVSSELPVKKYIEFLKNETQQVNGTREPHPAMIDSRAFSYKDIDRKSLNSGRRSFPERAEVDRTGEYMEPRQKVAYRTLEDIR